MRNPLSDKIVKIPPSGIRKFFDIVSEMKDAISLGVGEPDFETPWHIREEGIYSLEKGRTFYTSNAGLKPLKVEICEYLKRRCGVTYDPDQEILVTVGGSEAIDIALRAMLNEGDEVLIPQPSYVSYMPCVTLADGVPVTIELEEKDQFKLTPEKLLEKITDKTKILVLPFPNNPTGAIMEKEELEEIVKIVLEKDLFVISDEIYSELTYNGKRHVTIASFQMCIRDRARRVPPRSGAGQAATGSAARPAPFCRLCPQAMKEEGMLFFVMNILFPPMKMFCVRLISLLFYYFQFHFLHKCSRMGHKYKDCL